MDRVPFTLDRIYTPARQAFGCALPRLAAAATVGLLLAGASLPQASAQIGGKTAADGPFTLDAVEDLDTTASGVLRPWLDSYLYGSASSFEAVALTGSGLTLASGQTPTGALRFVMPTAYGYVNHNFGVAMPAVAGASTLTDPGDITSFTHLTFLVRASTSLVDEKKEVILTSYPASNDVYPTMHWSYTIAPGTTFQKITLDLRAPSYVLNGGTNTVTQLLSQTRYLSFYFYGGLEVIPKTLTAHVDDVQLLGTASVSDWALWD